MRLLVVSTLMLIGCPDAPPAAEPQTRLAQPDASWIRSEKLDPDLQELVLIAYDSLLAFPLRVTTRTEESLVRVRPVDVRDLVRDERVLAVRCATPLAIEVPEGAWREKLDPDVRTVLGAKSSCFTPVFVAFEREPSEEEWRAAEETGLLVHARDARSAIVWAPVRGIPRLAAMEFVARIERFSSP